MANSSRPAAEPRPLDGAALCAWFRERARSLPWRENRDPYRTWVSEVMLQQTTAAVVAPRYEKFLLLFPDLDSLARAEESEVEAAWAGLGYYRRARALRRGMQAVRERHGGVIPRELDELRALDGVGEYTAAAIRALAFDLPAVPLDGNVIRVLSRCLAEEGEATRVSVRRRLRDHALPSIPKGEAATFAEALIELGATVCRPQAPACSECPIADACLALELGTQETYPRKKAAPEPTPVRSLRAVLQRRGQLFLLRRSSEETLLPGQWELPGSWVFGDETVSEVLTPRLEELGFRAIEVSEGLAEARHSITRYRIRSSAWSVSAEGGGRGADRGYFSQSEMEGLQLTTETRKLLRSWSTA